MTKKKVKTEVEEELTKSLKETSKTLDETPEEHPFRKRADEVFASHNASVKEVYFTADGTAFLQMQHAMIHAASLKNDKIETLKREA